MAAIEENAAEVAAAEEAERAANQKKADELSEQARQEMIAESEKGAAASSTGKPARRASALAGIGIFDDLKAGPTQGGAEEEASKESDGYQVSNKASNNVADILAADAEDESLAKYKASLLGAAATGDLGDANDKRKLVVTEFRVIFEEENVPDAVFDLSSDAGQARLQSEGLKMKEGCKFKFQLSFRVNHELLEGLKFVNKTKRAVIGTSDELMIGSYAPASAAHVFTFPRYGWNDCPKGMMYRGKYVSTDTFIDAADVQHAEYSYNLTIGKTW
jgi:Rho GDP-dissociation inhibitor